MTPIVILIILIAFAMGAGLGFLLGRSYNIRRLDLLEQQLRQKKSAEEPYHWINNKYGVME